MSAIQCGISGTIFSNGMGGTNPNVGTLTQYTLLQWVRINGALPGDTFLMYRTHPTLPLYWYMEINNVGRVLYGHSRDLGVNTWTRRTSSTGIFSANTWLFVAVTVDLTTPTTDCWVGNNALTNFPMETLTNTGTTFDNDSSTWEMYQLNPGSAGAAYQVGASMIVNRILTAGEIQTWQHTPRMLPDGVWLTEPSTGNLSSVPDLSGNQASIGFIGSNSVVAGRWYRTVGGRPLRQGFCI